VPPKFPTPQVRAWRGFSFAGSLNTSIGTVHRSDARTYLTRTTPRTLRGGWRVNQPVLSRMPIRQGEARTATPRHELDRWAHL
jgi:hypothetical protein